MKSIWTAVFYMMQVNEDWDCQNKIIYMLFASVCVFCCENTQMYNFLFYPSNQNLSNLLFLLYVVIWLLLLMLEILQTSAVMY